MFWQILICAIIAILIGIVFRRDSSITGRLELNSCDYAYHILDAPVAKGSILDIASYLLTQSRFGLAVRRALLNDNHISNLRELASQIALPPLAYPMKRIKKNLSIDNDSCNQYLESAMTTFTDETPFSSCTRPSILNYAKAYQSGILPSAIMQKTLLKVSSWTKTGFIVFSSINEEDVMLQAGQSDMRHVNKRPLSVFDGVPVVIKDMIDVKGHIIYKGKSPLARHKEGWTVSDTDDIMVIRLRALGAIILGVSIMTEGGMTPLGYSTHFKGPFNPYSPHRYSGGSSSGSGAAVAAGLAPLAIGFDSGGSIRLPSAMMGLHGLAGTFGRFPFACNNVSESTMIKTGPMGASAEDVALAFAALAPNGPQDHFYSMMYDGGVSGPPAAHLTGFSNIQNLSDVRVGVFWDWFNDSSPEVRDRCAAAVSFLTDRGATVVPITIPHLQWLSLAHGIKISTEFASDWDLAYHQRAEAMNPNSRITVGLGSAVSAVEALAADKMRAWAALHVSNLFEELHLTAIVTPTVVVVAPVLHENAKKSGESNTALVMQLMKNVFLANFLGLPGYTVPVGFVEAISEYGTDSLPVGLHLLGNHWEEHKIMRLANAIEKGFTFGLPMTTPYYYFNPLA